MTSAKRTGVSRGTRSSRGVLEVSAKRRPASVAVTLRLRLRCRCLGSAISGLMAVMRVLSRRSGAGRRRRAWVAVRRLRMAVDPQLEELGAHAHPQLRGRAERDDPTGVHDRNAVAEALGLVEV